jgi:hypothetical protein
MTPRCGSYPPWHSCVHRSHEKKVRFTGHPARSIACMSVLTAPLREIA